jgi:hypothetical protein
MMPVHRTQASYHSMPFIPVCDTLYCRDCRGGFVEGISVITYFMGTGAEADHQLPGAIAHATVIARTRLRIKGPLRSSLSQGTTTGLVSRQPRAARQPACYSPAL